MRLSGINTYALGILVAGVVIVVVGLSISNHNVQVMQFSGSQSQVFVISGSSKDYFLEPVSQTNINLCSAPTIVTLYRQNDTTPVYSGQVTYSTYRSGGNWELNWNSMFLPNGLASGNYYFVVQYPSCRTGVTMALFKVAR